MNRVDGLVVDKSMQRRLLALTMAGLFALVLVACSSGSKTSTSNSPASAANADITIQNMSFTPSSVNAGSTVTVQNKDGVAHTVTADEGGFDVKVDAGSTATFTAPATAGTYQFHCKIHSSMHGTLTVTGSGGAAGGAGGASVSTATTAQTGGSGY